MTDTTSQRRLDHRGVRISRLGTPFNSRPDEFLVAAIRRDRNCDVCPFVLMDVPPYFTYRDPSSTGVLSVNESPHTGLTGSGHDRNTSGSIHRDSNAIFRFGLTVRLLHWWTVVTFATALLTGLAMGSEMEDTNLFHLHVAAVIAMGGGFVVAVIFGNTMAVLGFVRDAFLPERSDFEFVGRMLSRPFHRTGVRWGKFNLGQKGLAWIDVYKRQRLPREVVVLSRQVGPRTPRTPLRQLQPGHYPICIAPATGGCPDVPAA